jgi:hypothetical protein
VVDKRIVSFSLLAQKRPGIKRDLKEPQKTICITFVPFPLGSYIEHNQGFQGLEFEPLKFSAGIYAHCTILKI